MAKTKTAKKQRRGSVSSAKPRSYSELIRAEKNIAQQAEAPVESNEAAPVPRRFRSINWHAEYGDVLSDLRQLLIISALLFVAMIVLGYFI
jgi:hypothetical protein